MTQVVLKQGGGGDDLRYFVKPGLAGGQIGYGGLAAGENLVLGSTAHITKGQIQFGLSFYDDALDQLTLVGKTSQAVLGSELITSQANRTFASPGNWVGTGWTRAGGVYNHVAGANDATLDNSRLNSPPVAGRTYAIGLSLVTTTPGSLTPKFGGGSGNAIGGVTGGPSTISVAVTAVDATQLTFSPDGLWEGSIDNITVKEITPSVAVANINNSDGSVGIEIRSGGSSSKNLYIGSDAGRNSTGGNNNVALGANALSNSLTSTDNVSIGSNSMQYANALFNVAIGAEALKYNLGSNNIAIGYAAMGSNVQGADNTSCGAGSLTNNVAGYENSAFASNALYNNIDGNGNCAFGLSTLTANVNGSYVSAFGSYCLSQSTEDYNSALGFAAGAGLNAGSHNLFLGDSCVQNASSGSYNTVIGSSLELQNAAASYQLSIANIIFGTACDGVGTIVSSGNVGIGCTLRAAGVTYSRLSVAGGLLLVGDSTVQERERAALKAIVVDNTDATRKYGARLSAWDTAERIALEVAASGTAPMIGFLGTAAVVKAAALTAGLTLITHTAPGTPDYAIQDLTAGGFGFVTKDEGNTVLSVVLNLQNRVAQLESRLQAYGLLN